MKKLCLYLLVMISLSSSKLTANDNIDMKVSAQVDKDSLVIEIKLTNNGNSPVYVPVSEFYFNYYGSMYYELIDSLKYQVRPLKIGPFAHRFFEITSRGFDVSFPNGIKHGLDEIFVRKHYPKLLEVKEKGLSVLRITKSLDNKMVDIDTGHIIFSPIICYCSYEDFHRYRNMINKKIDKILLTQDTVTIPFSPVKKYSYNFSNHNYSKIKVSKKDWYPFLFMFSHYIQKNIIFKKGEPSKETEMGMGVPW